MRALSFLILTLAFAGSCVSTPPSPQDEMERLVGELPRSAEAEERLVAAGAKAIPALIYAVRRDEDPAVRSGSARALGRIYRSTGARLAVEAYVDALLAAPTPAVMTALLEQAHYFPDPDGQVAATVTAFLMSGQGVTAGVVRSAAALTEIEAMEPMMGYLSSTAAAPGAPGRDIAVRYLGRAAREGHMEAIDFLTKLREAATPDLVGLVDGELAFVAGKISVRSWRGWYLSVAGKKRLDWLIEAAGYTIGEPFDPSDRSHVDRLLAKMAAGDELEPEFAMLEPLLGRRFGYRSVRDVFDPTVSMDGLREANARSLETLKAWWAENAPYAWYDGASGRWEVNEDARQAGVPVDPKTGSLMPQK